MLVDTINQEAAVDQIKMVGRQPKPVTPKWGIEVPLFSVKQSHAGFWPNKDVDASDLDCVSTPVAPSQASIRGSDIWLSRLFTDHTVRIS